MEQQRIKPQQPQKNPQRQTFPQKPRKKRNSRNRYPIKRYKNTETQIPPTPEEYETYLLNKVLEKKQQFQNKPQKEPWNDINQRYKFIQSRYYDHSLHREYDDDELKEKYKNPDIP